MRTGIRRRIRRRAALVVLAAGALGGALLPVWPASAATPALQCTTSGATQCVPISGQGSTWSGVAFSDWTAGVHQYQINVSYTANGSNSGRTSFADGVSTFGASEIPYGVADGSETDAAPSFGYAYMPDTAGGTTFMYNLKIGNQRVTNLRLSGKTIADIFTGVITNWDNPEIQKDNPGLTMPNLPIIPVVRSDGSGATSEFTQWMLATQKADWTAYCAKVGFSPCTQTSAYPPLSGSRMVQQSGDTGVSDYVSQQQANGAIGYVEYAYALQTGFPVALVLNAAGYYTEPTAGHVAVSLLKAQINMDKTSPLYLTQNLSDVYTDTDPRTYELSSYSYMILPAPTAAQMAENPPQPHGFSTAKGYTLALFGSYLLCQGQEPLDALGYSSLPINLVLAGFQQLQKIPGNQVATQTTAQIQSCHNPTFDPNDTLGHNLLAETDPQPPACDKQGPTQCTAGTGGAAKISTPVRPAAAGGQPGSGGASGSGGTGTSQAGGTGSTSGTGSATGSGGGTTAPANCDPDSGGCTTGALASGSGTGGAGSVAATPTAASASLGDGLRVALLAVASALLLCLIVLPPVITQAGRRRRQRGRPGGLPPGVAS